jgi:sugar lactone lactonase YvrE
MDTRHTAFSMSGDLPPAHLPLRWLLVGMLVVLLQRPAFAGSDPPEATLRTDAPKDFLSEGLAWDATHRRFLLGSIRLHRVDAVDPQTGHASYFADAPGSVLGMQISVDGKSLWAAWTRFNGSFRHNQGTGIIAWSLEDGHRIGSWPVPDRDPRANLGDLLIIDTRTVVTTDSGTGAVYRFDTHSHRYHRLIPAGTFKSPQGIARSRQPGTVYMADYATGIWQVNLDNGTHRLVEAPKDRELRGIDGLYRSGNGLVAVQNGTRSMRVLWIALDDSDAVTRVDILAEGRASWDEPSLGTVVGQRFWFNATSQWGRFDSNLRALPDAQLQSPLLDSVQLPAAANAGHVD